MTSQSRQGRMISDISRCRGWGKSSGKQIRNNQNICPELGRMIPWILCTWYKKKTNKCPSSNISCYFKAESKVQEGAMWRKCFLFLFLKMSKEIFGTRKISIQVTAYVSPHSLPCLMVEPGRNHQSKRWWREVQERE